MNEITIEYVQEFLSSRFTMATVTAGETSAGYSIEVTIGDWIWSRQALTSPEAALRFATEAIVEHIGGAGT